MHTSYVRKGAEIEPQEIGRVHEAGEKSLPINSRVGLDVDKWKTEMRTLVQEAPKCHSFGMRHLRYVLNGRSISVYGCPIAIDHQFDWNKHADVHENLLTEYAQKAGEDYSGLCHYSSRGSYIKPWTLMEYQETCIEWGYGNKLMNYIPTGKFLKLLIEQDRFPNSQTFCTNLLHAVYVSPGSDAREKAKKEFSDPKRLAALLHAIAMDSVKNPHYR